MPVETATAEPPVIPSHRGWFFSRRFPDTLEAAFRKHYRRSFRYQTRALWYVGATIWLGLSLYDFVMFPAYAARLLPARMIALAFAIAAAVVASFPGRFKGSLHAITVGAGAGMALCAIVLFASVPYPDSFYFVLALTAICILTTMFAATLHYEYSALASLAVVGVFLVVVFLFVDVPTYDAVRLSALLAGSVAMSLAATNVIEGYARENFAQRLILERQSAAIAEKVQQLEASERRARDANRAKSVFLSNMSHELRTPLNAVLGFAQLMEREETLSRNGREHLEIIQRSGDHLLELINDVLAISKIEAGRITLSEQTFSLARTIRSVADMIRVRTEQKHLQFMLSLAPDLPELVVGDEGKLRQVLVNLLGNAVKFTETGGIALRAAWTGSAVLLEVEDTGYGIAGDEIPRLFEAFAQTESGRNSKEGTGLGLAISRNFVRLMGGDIRVRSDLGRGTTFTIEVPLRVAEGHAPEPKPRRATGLVEGQSAWRILVVDDAQENRTLLTRLLATVGLEVREASNGLEAVEAWKTWQPHLIWMDMRMPVMDGYEATQAIRFAEGVSASRRAQGASQAEDAMSVEATDLAPRARREALAPGCKIIALTASAFQHDRDEILANGCDDFVTKPFREATIFEKLEEHLGVEFLYDDPASVEAAPASNGLSATRLRALPNDVIATLRRAVETGDVEAADGAVGLVREHDETLAGELERAVRSFRFDVIQDALGETAI